MPLTIYGDFSYITSTVWLAHFIRFFQHDFFDRFTFFELSWLEHPIKQHKIKLLSNKTNEQLRYIFETSTIGVINETINVDDIVETMNHFTCIDMIIEKANSPLTEKYIKQLHSVLKSGTSDSRKDWFAVGEYKKRH